MLSEESKIILFAKIAQSARGIEYTDYFSAEG